MPFYADRPARRSRQLTADALWLVLVALSVIAGRAVHGIVVAVADPARSFSTGSADLAERLSDAGDTASRTPLIGDDLADVLDRSAGSASALAGAADEQVQSVLHLATALELLTALVPIVVVTAVRSAQRIRWARRAGQARRLSRTDAGTRVLALRALQHRDAAELLAVHPDPAQAWQDGDVPTVRALAELELRAVGLLLQR